MIRASILKNGALKITANNESRNDIRWDYDPLTGGGYYAAQDTVADELGDRFQFVRPEWVAALTDAPIITDYLSIGDHGEIEHVGDVWWYPGYMLTDPWQELKNKGRVIFDPEENNKSLPLYECLRCGKRSQQPVDEVEYKTLCAHCGAIVWHKRIK